MNIHAPRAALRDPRAAFRQTRPHPARGFFFVPFFAKIVQFFGCLLNISIFFCIFVLIKINIKKKNHAMTIKTEIKNLEKVQARLMRFCNYIEKHHADRYDDLYIKLGQVIGAIEDVLTFDEDKL